MRVYLCIYCIGSLLSSLNVLVPVPLKPVPGGAPHQEVQLEASHYVAALFNDLLFPAARLSTAHSFPPLDLDAAIPHA